ncbi:hypothetical protein PA905_48300 [Planktothrix agardhii CCAP 1459/11A]|jgi:cadmium resistance protein CadD (predicted permease)|uniref:Uncharacterized protein n=1 Tax=Planktothrix agardhii CCAP 1459/11A TaxID=282420 RepID=A0A4P5ZMA8_PLAAG|nr:hypothetical protein [Planktothrix rubescens]GDZ96304.1 hypothetical protein PA905_48300 [Planktothrix agardhii CCAP 1459/11A]CAD5919832.1 hypothetical protein NO108_00965 [Planktothrix rubescens]CAD5947356.1 hypothetical protein PCC7821_02302 [Planktothrix rubescens NIVA-CYA 18]CAH2572849.1 hypothetical protein PRNO82_02258 [Planktothrix rubescens]
MDWLIETIKVAIAVAIATTFDDNIYLTGFFSEVNRTFRPKHIVVGELIRPLAKKIYAIIKNFHFQTKSVNS